MKKANINQRKLYYYSELVFYQEHFEDYYKKYVKYLERVKQGQVGLKSSN